MKAIISRINGELMAEMGDTKYFLLGELLPGDEIEGDVVRNIGGQNVFKITTPSLPRPADPKYHKQFMDACIEVFAEELAEKPKEKSVDEILAEWPETPHERLLGICKRLMEVTSQNEHGDWIIDNSDVDPMSSLFDFLNGVE